MIYKISNLFNLNGLLNQLGEKTFNISTQYKFLKIKKEISSELSIYDEQKQYLIKEFAEIDENGQIVVENGGIKIKQECLEDCVNKINEMNAMQIQLPDIYFSLDELEPLNLTLGELELLEPFIKT